MRRVDRSHEAVLRNLLELYCHDLAEWLLLDAKDDGTYGYPPEKVWSPRVEVHLASLGSVPVGFALVGSAEPYVGDAEARDVNEFFVVRRHRRSGLGQALATHVFGLHPGRWLVRVYQGNLPALPFWRRIVGAHTGGAYREEVRSVAGRSWSYLTFDRTA
jgi:predicted acetyltransferase